MDDWGFTVRIRRTEDVFQRTISGKVDCSEEVLHAFQTSSDVLVKTIWGHRYVQYLNVATFQLVSISESSLYQVDDS